MNEMEQAPFWDARYAADGFVFGTEPNAFLRRQAARLQPGWTALAIADGEGRNGVWLAEQGLDVHSIDVSASAQAKAKQLADHRGVTLRIEQVDLDRWPWPEARYDVVAAIFIQFAQPSLRERIFAGIRQALKPGGLLMMEGYRPEQLAYGTGGPPVLEHLWDEALLRAAFADFEIVELTSYDAVIEEGAGHKGLSALIDLVARKPG